MINKVFSLIHYILFFFSIFGSITQYITIGATLSSEKMEHEFKQAVNALNYGVAPSGIKFNATTILMESNPIRSALDICNKLLVQHVYTVVASHPNTSDHSPISVSYTCGYYSIPVIGVSARDSAFSDMVIKQ